MSNKKSGLLVEEIIKASNRDEAIATLNNVLKALYLNSDYTELVGYKDKLNVFQTDFNKLSKELEALEIPHKYTDIHVFRQKFNFIYRELVDELVFDISRLRVLWGDDRRTMVRGEVISQLQEEKAVEGGKKPSISSLRETYGDSDSYKEWYQNKSVSYGLYKQLNSLLESIRLHLDSLASEEKSLLLIDRNDVK